MALVNVPPTEMPSTFGYNMSGASFYTNKTIDAAGEAMFLVCFAPKTGTIDKVLWNVGTSTTGDTVDVRLETVSLTDGNPTGTLLGTNSNGAQVVSTTNNVEYVTALTTGVAVTRGDLMAAGIVQGSTPGNFQIRCNGNPATNGFPYGNHFVSAAWVKSDDIPLIGFEYADGSYAWVPGVYPLRRGASTFNSSDSPDEIGNRFTLLFGLSVIGFYFEADIDNACDVVLYGPDGSAAKTFSLDSDVRGETGTGWYSGPFAGDGTIFGRGDTGRIALKPTTTSDIANFRFNRSDASDADALDSMPGGQVWHRTRRTDGGSWADGLFDQYAIGIIYDQIELGGVAHATMNGGMQ